MKQYICLCLFSCFCVTGFAQDSSLISTLLQHIKEVQVQNNNKFLHGNFPSYISNTKAFKTKRRDDNIFFASLIHYTLHQQYSNVPINDQRIIDSIQQQTAGLYKHFQNKKGRLTYNFWRTDTTVVFPYTKWIHRFKKNTSLPDDMDDTVLSLLAQNADSLSAAEAHSIMQEFINQQDNTKTIEKSYRKYHSYSVWYGKHFPPVYDVCVLSNILCFVEQYHLQWTPADSAALHIIVRSIQSDDFINKPLYISPYYGTTSLILYHLARLMSYENIDELTALQPKLISTAENQLASAKDPLQKVILSSALLKWQVQPAAIPITTDSFIQQIEKSNFPFFTGNIPSYFSPFFKRLFTQNGWLLFYHYCPAFNDALLIEYLLLRKNFSHHS